MHVAVFLREPMRGKGDSSLLCIIMSMLHRVLLLLCFEFAGYLVVSSLKSDGMSGVNFKNQR
jgi:hypothetical protein